MTLAFLVCLTQLFVVYQWDDIVSTSMDFQLVLVVLFN